MAQVTTGFMGIYQLAACFGQPTMVRLLDPNLQR